jgi:cystathionine beta-lyase/cystathionine gamma-synthase
MEAHQRSAQALAEMLEANARVSKVHYPGLASHPHHELAKKQQDGFGGMMSFEIVGGRPAAEHVFKTVKLYALAESLGGVESLIEYPDSMSHASMSQAARESAGITPNTIRLSAGIENPIDLVADLKNALDTIPA